MATFNRLQNFIEVTVITADVSNIDIFKDDKEKKIKRIEFQGGQDDDVCIIRQGSIDGPIITILSVGDVNLVDRCYFEDGGQFLQPFIDFSEGVFTAGHTLIIELS